MKITVYNRKYKDQIEFEMDKLTEGTRKSIITFLNSKGWNGCDCCSEVEKDD